MEEEFDKIYRETAQELFWVAYALTKDRSSAESAVQEAFIYLWKHREKLLGTSFTYPYLMKSVKNYALNYCREKYIRRKHIPQIIYNSQNIISDINEEQYADRIKQARELISELPERCRETFIKCVIEGMSYRKCASEMNVSVNTVKFHIKAAYDRLRKAVEEENILLFILLFFIIRKLNA